MFRKTTVSTAVLAVTLGLVACGGGGGDDAPAPVAAPTLTLGDTVALTASGKLISFNRATPGTLTGSVMVAGVAADEKLLDIDIRTASLATAANNGMLYALGSKGTIYKIDLSSGVATVTSKLTADGTDSTDVFTVLTGTQFSIDFNPTVDRLRVVSNTGQNLRINVDTGATITDGVITPVVGQATAVVAGVAYTNAFPGTATTRLFDINTSTSSVDLQNPPNNGALESPVALGVTPTKVAGYDIDASNNTGYAALTVGGQQSLYTINLGASTVASAVGTIGGGEAILGLALIQPKTVSVVGLASANQLVVFDPREPNTITRSVAITGLNAAGETIVGIDVRPQDGMLWGLSRAGNLYTLNTTTGAATFKVAITQTLDPTASYSVDFNPAANRLRVIGSNGQNLRIAVADVPATMSTALVLAGTTLVDGTINRADNTPSSVVAAAYTNSFVGTTSTALYDIDSLNNVFAIQLANAGTLTTIGSLNVMGNTASVVDSSVSALDMAGGDNGLVLAAIRDTAQSGPSALRTVNLLTGALTFHPNSAAVPGGLIASQVGGAIGAPLMDLAIVMK